MILASGGFGADFGSDSLLATYRPDLLHLPTTNGEHCTGGQKCLVSESCGGGAGPCRASFPIFRGIFL